MTELYLSSNGDIHIFSEGFEAGYSDSVVRYSTCHSQCLAGASWTTFVLTSAEGPSLKAAAVGVGGQMAALVSTFGSVASPACSKYLWCDGSTLDCSQLQNWSESVVFDYTLDGASLKLTPAGLPRVALVDTTGNATLTYGECNTLPCSSPSQWTTITVFRAANLMGNYVSLALDGSLPRIGFRASSGLPTYAACDSNCTTGPNWVSSSLNQATSYSEGGIALQIDAQHRPVLAYYLDSEVRVARCESGCTGGATWNLITMDSTSALAGEHPLAAPSTCGSNGPGFATWYFDTSISMVVDAQGKYRLVHGAWSLSGCEQDSPSNWVQANQHVRFAQHEPL